ncbi:MAG: hypothetical protein ACRC62_14425 [Microcoleus sp.]
MSDRPFLTKNDEGRRKKAEGRRMREEERRKKDEEIGRRMKDEGILGGIVLLIVH